MFCVATGSRQSSVGPKLGGAAALLILLSGCKVTATGADRLHFAVRAEEGEGKSVPGVEVRLGLLHEDTGLPSAFRRSICTTDERGICTGEAEYRFDASSYRFGRWIDGWLPRRPPALRRYFVEAWRGDRFWRRTELTLSPSQSWGEETIEVKLSGDPPPTEGARLLSESPDLAAAVAALRNVVGSKPISLGYDVLEDGSVADCRLRRVDGQESLVSQVPPELATDLCRAFSRRRYAEPPVRLNAEIVFGSPHLH